MKRSLLILAITLLLSTLSISAQTFEVKYYNSDYKLIYKNDSIVSVQMNKTSALLGDSISPRLPFVSANILCTKGTVECNPTFTYIKEPIATNVLLETVSNTLSNENGGNHYLSVARISSAEPYRYGGIGTMRGFTYANIALSPFEYDYDTRTLYFIKSFVITLNEKVQPRKVGAKNGDTKQPPVGSPSDISFMVINPDDVETLYPESTDENSQIAEEDRVDYLIITTRALEQPFKKLAHWKRLKGLKVAVEVCEDKPDRDELKNFIKDFYENHGIKWVLLGGGVSQIPTLNIICSDWSNLTRYITTPCDLYYACFDGALDWNANCTKENCKHSDLEGDPRGECNDDIDFIPEVYLSRLPAETKSSAEIMVKKILLYEQMPNQFGGTEKFLFSGTEGFPCGYEVTDNFYVTHDTINKDGNYPIYKLNDNLPPGFWLNPSGSSTNYKHWVFEIPFEAIFNPAFKKLYGHDYIADYYYSTQTNLFGYNSNNDYYTPENFHSLLNNGYKLFSYSGGSSDSSFILGSNGESSYYRASRVKQLKSGDYSIIVTDSPNTNSFDKKNCMSRAFLESEYGGAIAYFASSRNSYCTNDGIYYSFAINNEFLQMLRTDYKQYGVARFGEVASKAKIMAASSYISDITNYINNKFMRWLQYSVNPMGDPELNIYLENPSKKIHADVGRVNNNKRISVKLRNTSPLGVTAVMLSDDDYGESYCKKIILNDYETHYFELPDGTESNQNYSYTIALTKIGYIPLVNTFYYTAIPKIIGPSVYCDSEPRTLEVLRFSKNHLLYWYLDKLRDSQYSVTRPPFVIDSESVEEQYGYNNYHIDLMWNPDDYNDNTAYFNTLPAFETDTLRAEIYDGLDMLGVSKAPVLRMNYFKGVVYQDGGTNTKGIGRTLICDPEYVDPFNDYESSESGSEVSDSVIGGDIGVPAFPSPARARATSYEKIIHPNDEILVNRDEVVILESELIKFVDDDLDAMTPTSHIGKVKKENGTMAFKIPNNVTYYPLTLTYNAFEGITLNFVGVEDINSKMYVIQRGSNIEIVLNLPEEEQHEWYSISCYTLTAGSVFFTEAEYQDRIILNYDLSAYKGLFLYISVRGEMSLNEYVTGFPVQ